MRTQQLVLRQKMTESQIKQRKMIDDLERELFNSLNLQYQVFDIPINEEQRLHTIFVHRKIKQLTNPEIFFFSHGFGGSSLMKFPVVGHLLQKGDLVFWQIRGMGLNQKVDSYDQQNIQYIEEYFQEGLLTIINFYKPTGATLICHSFSSYIALLFTIRNLQITKKYVKQLLMLSPIGLTPKEQDYKRQINSCGDFIQSLIHKLAFKFNLTYKSPLRTVSSCCKKRMIINSLKEENMSEEEREMIYRIIEILIMLPDGSECLFYKYFLPRVLPIVPLQPLFTREPIVPIVLVYGGKNDWVDRKGAERMAMRFPQKIKVVQIPNITHNIAFHPVQCNQLFRQLFL